MSQSTGNHGADYHRGHLYLGDFQVGSMRYDLYIQFGSMRVMDVFYARYGCAEGNVLSGGQAHGGLFYPALVEAERRWMCIAAKDRNDIRNMFNGVQDYETLMERIEPILKASKTRTEPPEQEPHMLYIFRQFNDPVGEGLRAELHEFPTQSEANKQYDVLRSKDDTVFIKMILGTSQKEDRPYEESRTLSDDELRVSDMQVEGDTEKENV